METETNVPEDASAMQSTTPEDKHSMAQFDSIPNQCETAKSIKLSCGLNQHPQCSEYTTDAEDKTKGDTTTNIMITSTRTQEDKSSVESSSPDKPSTENVSELSYYEADKIVNRALKQVSENEPEDRKGTHSKDIEKGDDKIQVINNTKKEERDHDIDNEAKVSTLACAEEPNLEVHEQESSRDNSDSFLDHHLEAILNQHASIEVISETTEKQLITSHTYENTGPKDKEDADLECTEQATSSNVQEGEWKAPESIRSSNELAIDNDMEDKPIDGKIEDSSTVSVAENRDEETSLKAALSNGYNDNEKFKNPSFNQATDGASAEEVAIEEGNTVKDNPEKTEVEAPSENAEKSNLEGSHIARKNEEKEEEDEPTSTSDSSDKLFSLEKAFDLYEAMGDTSTENEKKAEPQSEAQSMDAMETKHPNLEEKAEISPSNDIEELEKFPVSHNGEKLEINESGKIIQEEVEEMQEASKMQLLRTAAESVTEVKALSTLPTSAIIKHETDMTSYQDQTDKQAETKVIDVNISCRPENELEQTTKVLEAIDITETTGKVRVQNQEYAHNQSGAQSMENLNIKHTNLEGAVTTESSTKLSNDKEELENIPKSQSVKNLEIKNGRKIMPEEAEDIKEAIDAELQKPETEGVPEDKVLSTLPTIASVRIETVEKTIQEETYKEPESAATDANEKQRPENDFEDYTEVLEAFDLQKATGNTCAENEKKAERQSQVQSLETMVIKHLNLEGSQSAEISISNDTEELENIPASHPREKLEIKDGGKIIQEEATDMEKAADMQLLKTATESLPEDEVRSTLPTLAIFQVETIEKSIKEQTHEEEESTTKDNDKSCRSENELEQTAKVLEATDIPETMGKFGPENGEHADHQPEEPSLEKKVITKHTESEEMVKTESSTISSCDVKELEKVSESLSIENLEIKDGGKVMQEEKQATDVKLIKPGTQSEPEDQTHTTLPTIAPIGVETVERNIQEEIYNEAESTVTDTEEGQKPENDFVETKKVPEAFDLQEAISSTIVENKKKAEPHPEAQSLETMVKKHPNLEGLETNDINTSYDTEELEKVPASRTGEKLEIKSGRNIIQDAEKEMEQITDMHLLKTARESVHEHEAPSMLPTSPIVVGETIEKIIQEKIHDEEESTVIDDDKSSRSENEHKQTTKILEAIYLPETMSKVNEENEEQADNQTIAQSMENVIRKHTDSEEMVTTESIRKTGYNVKELENTPESPVENREIKDGGQITLEQVIGMPEDETLSTLHPIASVGVETVEEKMQEEIHKEAESAKTDTGEGQTQENDFDDKRKVLEANDLPKTTGKVNTQNEQAEHQSKAQSLENFIIQHIDSKKMVTTLPTIASVGDDTIDGSIQEEIHNEAKSATTNTEEGQMQDNDFEDKLKDIEAFDLHEAIKNTCDENEKKAEHLYETVLDTRDILVIMDGARIIQEDEKKMELATEKNLPKSATESVPVNETLSNLPSIACVGVETADGSTQEIHKEDKSAVTDTKEGQRQE